MAVAAPPRRRVGRYLLIAGLAVVLVGAGLAVWAFIALRGTKDILADLVPRGTTAYVTAYLDPSAEQKVRLNGLIGTFPALKDRDDLDRRLNEFLDDALAPAGLTAGDVRPWIGSQVAIAVRLQGESLDEPPRVTLLIASRDDDAARAALQKLRTGDAGSTLTWEDSTYGGVPLSEAAGTGDADLSIGAYALIEHTVVLATDISLLRDVIDTRQGKVDAISSDPSYTEASGALPDGRLGLAYVDLRPVFVALTGQLEAGAPGSTEDALGQLAGLKSAAASVSARSDGLGMDFNLQYDRSKLSAEQLEALDQIGRPNATLAFTPASAYGVLAFTGLRPGIQSFLDQFGSDDPIFQEIDAEFGITDALRSLTGDIGLEVGPGQGPDPTGALLLGTTDEGSLQRLLDRAVNSVLPFITDSGTGAPIEIQHETYRGADVSILSVSASGANPYGLQPAWAVTQGMAIIGWSPDEVKEAIDAKATGSSIMSGERFREAVEAAPGDMGDLVYVDVQAIAGAIRATLSGSALETFDREIAPNLTPVRRLILNLDLEGDRLTERIVVLIR